VARPHAQKEKFRPVIKETSQSRESIHGRGASWIPANRFEKLHVDLTDVDLTDVDLVDDDTEAEDNPRRSTQYFDDKTKAIVAHNQRPDVGFE
jgi:hypothetical protein